MQKHVACDLLHRLSYLWVMFAVAEYVKRFAKKVDADETAGDEDMKDGSASEGFLSSSDDDEDDLPANGRMT